MSSGRLRHHSREEQSPLTPSPLGGLSGGERAHPLDERPLSGRSPEAGPYSAGRPLTPSAQAAAELGPAASLLQIASRLPQPSGEDSMEILRQRMRTVLASEPVPRAVLHGRAFHDQITTTDSIWIPALKWGAAALAAAALSAIGYYLLKNWGPSFSTAAIPAAGLAFSASLRRVSGVDTRPPGTLV